jgi:hypothetical protein
MVMVKVLGVPFDSEFFFSSFLQDSLDEDVHYVDMLLELGHIQIAFEMCFWMFHVEVFLFVFCIFASLELSTSACIFQFDRPVDFGETFKPKFSWVFRGLWWVGKFCS